MTGEYKLIGVCMSKIQQEHQFRCIKAINEHACKKNYRLLIFNACTDLYAMDNADDIGEAAIFQLINYDMLSAMIILTATLHNETVVERIVQNCRAHHLPILTVDVALEGCVNFSFDYSNTFERLCRHVIEDHHVKNVLMMAGMQNNRFSEVRIQAFRTVLEDNHIPFSNDLVGYGDFWDGPTKETMVEWFDVQKREVPEAIICANDSMAVVVSQFLQDHGYRVPEDCIVTGFDGIMQASYHIPHLTTCMQNYNKMGSMLIDTIERISNGLPCEDHYVVDFHIMKSQSCGCEATNAVNVNDAVQEILERFRLSQQRQDLVCQLQSAITNMSSLSELPPILIDKFVFHTMVFAVNDDIFRAPEFGEKHRGDNAFGKYVNVLYSRNFWVPNDPCVIQHTELAPNLIDMLKREDPIICCCIHFMDLILGYSMFQPEINYDEYEKIRSFMNAIDSSLGIFHSQMHTKSINMQLKSVNNELEKLYVHDHMTGLLNRRGFYRQFRQQLVDSNGKDLSVVLISADLDDLKYINDTFGHTEGDNAIITVGRALMTSAIQGEVCSRFGGDEFTVAGIISDKGQNYFESFKTRFRNHLKQYNCVSQKPYQVESSIGFCMEPLSSHIDLDKMIKKADDHMYDDKMQRKKTRR